MVLPPQVLALPASASPLLLLPKCAPQVLPKCHPILQDPPP